MKFKKAKKELWQENWDEYCFDCHDWGVEVELSYEDFEPSDEAVKDYMRGYPTSGYGWKLC